MSLKGLVSGEGCGGGATNALTSLASAVLQSAPPSAISSSAATEPASVQHSIPPPSVADAIYASSHDPLAMDPALASIGHSHGQEILNEDEVADSFSNLDLTEKDLEQLETEYAEFARAMDADPSPETMENFWQHAFWNDMEGVVAPKEYTMSTDNPFLEAAAGVSGPSLHEAGRKLFGEGRLEESIWAFEAALQVGGVDLSDTWRWIGTAQAENDHDQVAILCLEKSIAADPDNVEALLDLGVSYTNELNHDKAMHHLAEWLRKNDVYAAIPSRPEFALDLDSYSPSFEVKHKRMIDMYMLASTMNPADPDVWTVLGVLYNLSRDYALAEDAFRKALQYDPDSYSLWNKLGATMANSPAADGSKQAVYAYRKAIELKPSYTRAWVNMGISYSNQSMYDLAAKYYLRALSLNPTASHVWSYLRIALECLKRPDLIEMVSARDVNLFRDHFQF